ncbi:MAG TPA: F0F1 ATP synthase subunit C, partial [Sulfuricurvum sp.]|nr:F0F1 ATP synthase subunit C [Sulfuricurvum sp.]
MKKVLFLMTALVAAAFGADEAVAAVETVAEVAPAASADVANQMLKAYSMIAAGVGLGLAALGGAIGMGSTAAATIAGTARNPGLGGKLMTTMFIALAMIEAQVIYTLVIALIALYA